MSLFTSNRERRLWTWVLVVVVAIYSTLGLAGTLAEILLDRNLLDNAYVLSALLVLVTIVTQGLKTRPGGIEIAVAIGVGVAYLMVIVRMGIPGVERTHLIEYGVVAVLVFEALMERASNGSRVPVPAALAVVLTVLIGWLDEGIQAILPNRVYDFNDVIFNALASLMAITASLILSWVRQRVANRK